ncbi:SRPBCC domain-containing protein [Nocardia carnea]|uniref:SRPBCC domain-containing protein n=1 Tax=Nocardia carnea TaxID=37328 RepID=UPI00245706BF|nr:SRPBCC domain-containing protein [Nocardia carnea]
MLVVDDVVEVDAPAEVVWSVLTDFDRYSDWNPFIGRCRADLTVGAPIDMRVQQLMPLPIPMREFIHTVTPGREFGYSMKPLPLGALRSNRSHTLTPLGDDRTRYESHFELAGWLAPLVGLLFGRGFRRGFPGMTTAVEREAERRHTA